MIDRLNYNLKITERLNYIFKKAPYLRFTQLLTLLSLDKDLFYEESDKTLDRIEKYIALNFN